MRRILVLLPLAAVGVSLAVAASAADPAHKPADPSKPSASKTEKAPAKTPKVTKHRKGRRAEPPKEPHPTLAIAMRRADYDVVEGTLGQSMPGAVCPPE